MTYTIDFERKADEMDEPFEPTADDYFVPECPACGDPIDYCQGGHDTCRDCGAPISDYSPSLLCDACDDIAYRTWAQANAN